MYSYGLFKRGTNVVFEKRFEIWKKRWRFTHTDRDSGRLTDAVLTKFQDAFFAALPPHNPLSSEAAVSKGQKE